MGFAMCCFVVVLRFAATLRSVAVLCFVSIMLVAVQSNAPLPANLSANAQQSDSSRNSCRKARKLAARVGEPNILAAVSIDGRTKRKFTGPTPPPGYHYQVFEVKTLPMISTGDVRHVRCHLSGPSSRFGLGGFSSSLGLV